MSYYLVKLDYGKDDIASCVDIGDDISTYVKRVDMMSIYGWCTVSNVDDEDGKYDNHIFIFDPVIIHKVNKHDAKSILAKFMVLYRNILIDNIVE